MSILNKYNTSVPQYDYDNEKKREFKSLKEVYTEKGKEYVSPVEAIFINDKSKFGSAPVVISGDYMVNFPHHLTDIANDMREDEELTELVNNGKIGFKIYQYTNDKGTGYSVTWVEA